MSDVARLPAGTPAGGRFATTVRHEAGVWLVENPRGLGTDTKEAVTAAVLAHQPDATSWQVPTRHSDAGWVYDPSRVQVTTGSGRTSVVNVHGTPAAGHLRELSRQDFCEADTVLAVDVPATGAAAGREAA